MPSVRRSMALSLKHGISLWCPQSSSLNRIQQPSSVPSRTFQRSYVVASSSFANENREFVIVGGGNAAGYAARTFVEHGMANGKLCIVSKEAYAPYERPALTKAYLFPSDKKPARLPGFHTCVGSGGERQTPDWYNEQGIEMLYEDPVTGLDIDKQTLTTNSGKLLKYGSLIIATGCTASRFPDKIGGNLTGVHYIRDVADADSLIASLEKARKVVVVGGGYIGMEVAAAAVAWKLDTTVIFPEDHLLQRLFTPSLARKYEELYEENGVKFVKGISIKNLEAGSDGRVTAVKLENGSTIEADTVIIGIGAKPAISPFERVGLNTTIGGIQVDGQFRTSIPGIFAVGDVAAFPLKIYNRTARVEHVDHARRSAQHCIKALLSAQTHTYDYLPYFYSRVFEYEGSPRKVWWQFFGDNVGETVQIGNFDPKIATFWIDSGKLKGVLLESGSSEMGSKQKWWYVVFVGRNSGIYTTWKSCSAQIHRFSEPVFRKYPSLQEAEEAYFNYKRATYPNEVDTTVPARMFDPPPPPPLQHMVHPPQHAPLMYFICGFLFAIVVLKLIKWL